MIALDTNVLITLLVSSQSGHEQARQWLEKTVVDFATTSTNIAEALRLLTHPRVFPSPLKLVEAIDLLERFLETFDVRVLEDSTTWLVDLKGLMEKLPGLRGNEVFDARIALCLKYHGVSEIATFDSDFLKYPFLKVIPIR